MKMTRDRVARRCAAFNFTFFSSHRNPQSKNTPTCSSHPTAPRLSVNRRTALLALLALDSYSQTGIANPDIALASDVKLSDDEWRDLLSPDVYRVLRQAGTERPYTSMQLLRESRPGVFVCKGCSQPLFTTSTKFDSGTGWPSFYAPIPKSVRLRQTNMDRMLLQREVVCASCEGHLGHVFHDGPKPTGDRYCINGIVLIFKATEA